MVDPNPAVSGSGLQKLRDAGIEVQHGLLEDQARRELAGFISRMATGRPRIRAKLAMSLDGRTAMASGESQWITGPAARADVQRLRAASCAIVTGAGTVLSDDCALTLRPEQLDLPSALAQRALAHPPQRVVLDSRLRTPAGAKVLAGGPSTLLLHHLDTPPLALPGADLCPVPGGDTGLDLTAVVAQLAARQFNEILVESGPRLAGGLLQAGLLDELLIYMAPTLMGSKARPLLQLPLDEMADKVALSLVDVRQVGVDWRFTAVPG
jgi:diaminohydroxyphosphoribosylaminopyrimidine deaminase/5-amino-6-(5-phosphoribosylamino)uracil reductase